MSPSLLPSPAAVAALLLVLSSAVPRSANAQLPGGRAFDQVPRRDPGMTQEPMIGAEPPPSDEGLGGWGPEPRRDGAGMVRVQLESPQPATLYQQFALREKQTGRRIPIIGYEKEVCTSPCEHLVDASSGQLFTIGLEGAPSSDPFLLDGHGRHVTVDVDPGDDGMLLAGQLMLGPGIGAAAVGGFLLAISASDPATDVLPTSVVLLGSAAALITAGVVLVVVGDTDVEVRPSPPAPRARSRPPRLWRGEF